MGIHILCLRWCSRCPFSRPRSRLGRRAYQRPPTLSAAAPPRSGIHRGGPSSAQRPMPPRWRAGAGCKPRFGLRGLRACCPSQRSSTRRRTPSRAFSAPAALALPRLSFYLTTVLLSSRTTYIWSFLGLCSAPSLQVACGPCPSSVSSLSPFPFWISSLAWTYQTRPETLSGTSTVRSASKSKPWQSCHVLQLSSQQVLLSSDLLTMLVQRPPWSLLASPSPSVCIRGQLESRQDMSCATRLRPLSACADVCFSSLSAMATSMLSTLWAITRMWGRTAILPRHGTVNLSGRFCPVWSTANSAPPSE